MKFTLSILIVTLMLQLVAGTEARSKVSGIPDLLVDTIVIERVDASDFILGFQYFYVEGDTGATNEMQRREKSFLRTHGLPTSGVAEDQMRHTVNMEDVNENYDQTLVILKKSPHRDLYRRVCSDMLIKYLCSSNKMDEAYLNSQHNRLIFFLNEMRESGSINVELIYYAFLKFQYKNNHYAICSALKDYLPFFQKGVMDTERSYQNRKSKLANENNKMDAFILEVEGNRMNTRKEYLTELLRMKNVVCK